MQGSCRYGATRGCGEPCKQAQITRGDFGSAGVVGATAHIRHGAYQVLTPQQPTASQVDEGQSQTAKGNTHIAGRHKVGHSKRGTEGRHAQPRQVGQHLFPVLGQVGYRSTEDKAGAHHQ